MNAIQGERWGDGRWGRLTIGGALALAVASCASKLVVYDDPIAAMANRELTTGQNLEAMEQAAERFPDDPRRIDALKTIVSQEGYLLTHRIAAFEQLEGIDPAEAKATLVYRLPTSSAWDFVEWSCGLIVERGWADATPALIRSLYRPSPIHEPQERPERQALAALHPGRDIREVIFETVITPPRNMAEDVWRLKAWELLNRLGEPEVWRERLAAAPADDPLVASLRAGYVEFGVLARTSEEIKWLQWLLAPERAAWRAEIQAVVAALRPWQRENLRLRHLAVLVNVRRHHADWLDLGRDELVSRLEQRLAERKHYHPEAVTAGAVGGRIPQSLAHWRDNLSWADALTILLADEWTRWPAVRAAAFEQSLQDRADTTTEFGGIVDWMPADAPGPIASPFITTYRTHDRKFYASNDMVHAGYTAPFHYHYHAQEERNAEFAGPGLGDLQYADAMAVNGVVFTSVGRNRLNVDVYTEGGVTIDLGVIEP